jgi:acetyltransferase-like isoleucine patch superfamily enzyme
MKDYWMRFWMIFASRSRFGRFATWMATIVAPPFFRRNRLAEYNEKGYISPKATIDHSDLRLGKNIFIGDRVDIFRDSEGGSVTLDDNVRLHWDMTLQTGMGGTISIGARSTVQPRCHLSAYVGSIQIGNDVHIAPSCGFYPYNHGFAPGELIVTQKLKSRGDIVLEDDVWIGFGAIVLEGVRIGKGSIIGAGSVVVGNIPPGAIAVGSPAKVIRMRADCPDGDCSHPAETILKQLKTENQLSINQEKHV